MSLAETRRMSKLREFLTTRSGVGLFVGAVSRNAVDAAIEAANETGRMIGIVASRRQIESADFGGGYCNRWTTEGFVDYVRSRDTSNCVVIQRDHGGPWQGSQAEKDLTPDEAMARAKRSFLADIESGFDAIHIDPYRDEGGRFARFDDFLTRTVELLEFCVDSAMRLKSGLPAFEIGTDEGNIGVASAKDVEVLLCSLLARISPTVNTPAFVAIPTGTRIRPFANASLLPLSHDRARLLHFVASRGLLIKQHNSDYLTDQELRWIGTSITGAINIAPQLGVIETQSILNTLDVFDLTNLSREFVSLANRQGD